MPRAAGQKVADSSSDYAKILKAKIAPQNFNATRPVSAELCSGEGSLGRDPSGCLKAGSPFSKFSETPLAKRPRADNLASEASLKPRTRKMRGFLV